MITLRLKKQYLKDTFGEKFDTEKKIRENFVEFIDIFNEKGRLEFITLKIENLECEIELTCQTEKQKEQFLARYAPYDSIEKIFIFMKYLFFKF